MSALPEKSVALVGPVICLAIVGLAGNLLVILTILRSRSLQGLTHYLLLNLAVADSLVCVTGLLGSPLYLTYTPCREDKEAQYWLIVYFYLHRAVAGQSVLGLLLVTFERFVGIVHPLRHQSYFSRRRVAGLLTLVWVTPPVVEMAANVWFFVITARTDLNCTAAPDLPKDGQSGSPRAQVFLILLQLANALLFFLLPAAALAGMYARILRSLRRSAGELQALGLRGPPRELQRAATKVVRVLLLVSAAFVLFVLPDKVVSAVVSAGYDRKAIASVIPLQVSHLLTVANSAVNPLLYGLSYEKFRRAVRATLCPRAAATRPQQSNCQMVSMQS